MDPSMEIRHLPPTHLRELISLLEEMEFWKRLMSRIPKTLRKETFECPIDRGNPEKYKSDDYRKIEAAATEKRKCSAILLHEWGHSGRVRPAIGHLLYLLVKAELYRAGDYVAVKILQKEAPERPPSGPAAVVPTPSEEITFPQPPIPAQPPPTRSQNTTPQNTIQRNLEANNKRELIAPEIVISETPEIKEESFKVPLVIQNYVSNQPSSSRSRNNSVSSIKSVNNNVVNESVNEVSNMIKFSTSSVCVEALNELLTSSQLPMVTELNPPTSELNNNPLTTDSNVPILTLLNGNTSSSSENANSSPNLSDLMRASQYSNILRSETEEMSSLNDLSHSRLGSLSSNNILEEMNSNILPDLDLLNPGSGLSLRKSPSTSSASSRPSCHSPLPNLSLNTLLPHYNYYDIERSTKTFDETPHKSCVSESEMVTGGRFLGKGAFGSVFLALDLTEKPVAVKKLVLTNVDVVEEDDTVTKQFRNEVEILSKYKHENLLALVGYSCDGPTYCLLYEYISGGALIDRLQDKDNVLYWKERLNISLGTAKAISYLHTAFKMPLVHRDIKSANILLNCANQPKLCDFGLIKLTSQNDTARYYHTEVIGTSTYMSPEAFKGTITVKLDTFSFGIVLYELLTSLPPYNDSRSFPDLMTYVQDVCDDDILPLLDIYWKEEDTHFAQELFQIANKCLTLKHADRPVMVDIEKDLVALIETNT